MTDATPPTLDYRPADPGRRRRRAGLWIAVAVGVALLLLTATLLLPITTRRAPAPRATCASHEHQIGLAILLYQQDNGGHYPPSLSELPADEQISSDVFVCPESNDAAATFPTGPTGPTTRQVAAAWAVPGHLSYLYFGHADWTDPVIPADAVVLAEPPADHGNTGSNVLYGDGHADWVPMPRAARLIAAAAATTRPVSAAGVP